jgi:hypothetical protein
VLTQVSCSMKGVIYVLYITTSIIKEFIFLILSCLIRSKLLWTFFCIGDLRRVIKLTVVIIKEVMK